MITVILDPAALPKLEMPQPEFDAAYANYFRDLPIALSQINDSVALINMLSAGSGFALSYTFSTTTTDADPTPGFMRLSNATQNLATVMRLDVLSGGKDMTAVIDDMISSSSANKGQIRLVKAGDVSKYMVFNLTGRTVQTGYRNLSVTHVASSSPSPFVDGDPIILCFSRTGDVGSPGSVTRRVASTATATAPAPNASSTDLYILSAQATAAGFIAPTGSPGEGQPLVVRIKDNGTPQLLTFTTAYRASTDLAFPGTTLANKTLYLGFNYNTVDSKWDLVALLNNI